MYLVPLKIVERRQGRLARLDRIADLTEPQRAPPMMITDRGQRGRCRPATRAAKAAPNTIT